MASPIWYLGPLGDLRALVCPEIDIDMTVERYGGSFQSLSGARRSDLTGLRQKFDFNFTYLDQDEFKWYEALYQRLIPGPFRLINPLKKNRLTPESSSGRWGGGTAQGLTLTSGQATMVWDWPTAAGTIGGVTTKWSGRVANAVFRADYGKFTTMLPLETVTASVYLKATANLNYNLIIDWYDRLNHTTSSSIIVAAVTTSWQMFSVTATAPAGTMKAIFAGYSSNTAADVFLGPMQFEAGATATAWELGGGSPVVSVDQLPVTSPRFPYRNISMTLLEV